MISALCRSDVSSITGAVEAIARFFRRAAVFVGAFVALSFACAPSSWAAAGDRDPTFGGGDGIVVTDLVVGEHDGAADVLIQPDGRIVALASQRQLGSDIDWFALIRYLADGSVDSSFGTSGIAEIPVPGAFAYLNAGVRQADGKLVVVGESVTTFDENWDWRFVVARVNPSGSLDTTFGTNGVVVLDTDPSVVQQYANFGDVVIQPDGKIVAAGHAGQADADFEGFVARFEANGTLDPTFGYQGLRYLSVGTFDTNVRTLALQPDGKLVIAGRYENGPDDATGDSFVARLHADGNLDLSFGQNGVVKTAASSNMDEFTTVTVLPDGRILAAGEMTNSDATQSYFLLARYESNGDIDLNFGNGGIASVGMLTFNFVGGMVVEANGRIVLAGTASDGNAGDFALARFNTTGDLDPTFGPNGTLRTAIEGHEHARGLALQSDGRLVAVGFTATSTDVSARKTAVVRYLTNTCGNGLLELGEDCEDGNIIDGDCCSSDCQAEPAGQACESDSRFCTLDVCDGNGACSHPPATFPDPCRAATEPCDVAEFCDGISVTCPANQYAPASQVCRASSGACDDAEFCSGVSAFCPADELSSAGTVCRPGTDACDADESCTGTSPDCPADELIPNGAVCRAAAGICDLTEYCTGTTSACPADQKRTAVCRPAAGQCDAAETCNGVNDDCPVDAGLADDTPCDDGGVCTNGDVCRSGVCIGSPCQACEFCDLTVGCLALPRINCKQATDLSKTKLTIFDRDPEKKDKLQWKWNKGEQTDFAELGDPLTSHTYSLCVWDRQPSLVFRAVLPKGTECTDPRCWKDLRGKGYRYLDKERSIDGVHKLVVKAGEAGKAKLQLKTSGGNMPDTALPLDVPVRVQVQTLGTCWEGEYSDIGLQRNDAEQFKARGGPTPTVCCESAFGCADLRDDDQATETCTLFSGAIDPSGPVCNGATGACEPARTGITYCCQFPTVAGPICLEGPLGADPGLCLSNDGTHFPGAACQASGFCE